MFGVSVPMSQWGSGEWLTFGVIALTLLTAAVGACLQLEFQIFSPRRQRFKREEELNDPVDMHFLVPPLSQRRIEYAQQDDREHLLSELLLAPNTSTLVELRLHPRTRFVTTEFLFGCVDDPEGLVTSRKPRPVELIDVYGQGHITPNSRPNETPGHVINSRLEYRWNYERKWNGLTTLILGIRIETDEEGRYLWHTTLIGDEAETVKELVIHVTKRNDLFLNCVNGEHERHSVIPAFRGTSRSKLEFVQPNH